MKNKSPNKLKLQDDRMDEAIHLLDIAEINYDVIDNTKIIIDGSISFFPFTGWFSGKKVVDGRGIENLIKQLKKSC